MVRLRFAIDGDVQVSRVLDAATEAVSDLTPAWEQIAEDFRAEEEERFGGGEWAPLSPAYAAWKARHFPGKGILRRTGRLYESLTGESQDSVADIEPLRLTLGTRTPYAVFHQRGTSRMPARPVIDLSPGFRRTAVRRVQRHLAESIRSGR